MERRCFIWLLWINSPPHYFRSFVFCLFFLPLVGSMGSSLTRFWSHVVFSTKHRAPIISPQIEEQLYPYINGIIQGEKGELLKMGGTSNHLHLLLTTHPIVAFSEMMRKIKDHSSKWVNEKHFLSHRFSWQEGYGAFSVSESLLPKIVSYIANQKEHH